MTADPYGLSARTEPGWTTRVYQRAAELDGEVTRPVLHACTRELPPGRGDLGGGVPALLGVDDVFVSLVDFGPEVAGEGLFAPSGRPRLAPSQFSPDRLQQVVPGRSAAQHFFTEAGRGFCLFVILGSHARRMALVPRAHRMVAGITVSHRRVQPRGWR